MPRSSLVYLSFRTLGLLSRSALQDRESPDFRLMKKLGQAPTDLELEAGRCQGEQWRQRGSTAHLLRWLLSFRVCIGHSWTYPALRPLEVHPWHFRLSSTELASGGAQSSTTKKSPHKRILCQLRPDSGNRLSRRHSGDP